MANIELRTSKRQTRKERDLLMPILFAVVAIGVGGILFLKHAEKAAQAANAKALADESEEKMPELSRMQAPATAVPIPRQTRQNLITTESGKTYYVEPTPPSQRYGDEPSAAERYARASRIMESTATTQAPPQYSYRNDTLRIADAVCRAVLHEGTIAYRECRAAQWRRLRDGCISRRNAMNITTGSKLDAIRQEVEEWCSAEAKYRIVD